MGLPTESSREAVFEAGKRGLSPSLCADILGRGTTVKNVNLHLKMLLFVNMRSQEEANGMIEAPFSVGM